MKDNINKILIFIGIYIIILVTGCFAVVDIWKTQGLTSKVYGALNIQTNNEINENEFNFIYTGFKETADNKYSFTQTNITDLSDLSEYSLKINSRDCETQSTNNTMFCTYSVAFKNYENNIIVSDTLNISVALHSGNLTFIFITENENAIPYWNKHFDLEGFKVELVKVTNFEIEQPIIKELEPVLYWEYEGEQKSVEVVNNTIDMKVVLNNVLPVGVTYASPSEFEDLIYTSTLYINDVPLIDDCASMTAKFDSSKLLYTISGYSISLYTDNFSILFADNSNLEFTFINEGTRLIDGQPVETYWGVFKRYTASDSFIGGLKIQGFEEPLTINLAWEINTIEI